MPNKALEAGQRPNILWISTHDINPHLGAYSGVWPGAEHAITPNLDRLAAEGVRFNKAFATVPVCGPSRSSVMTGRFPTSIGTLHMRTKAVPPPEVKLISEYFRAEGYYTTCNGFTDFQVDTPPTAFHDCSPTAHWRNRPTAETPFFAQFHGFTTHESQIYLNDEQFAQVTSHVRIEERHDPDRLSLPPYYPDTPVFHKAWARIYELITEMDYWVGDILNQLEEDGLAENTIVVFWSDHGPGFPRAKRFVYEAGLREPLIIRWPGHIEPGLVREDVVHVMDIAPTMFELCGLPVLEHMEAKSLYGADGMAVMGNGYAFGARGRMDEQEDLSFTVRDDRYRYIRHYHPDRPLMQHCHYPDHLATWSELRRMTAAEARQLAMGEERSLLDPLQRSVVGPNKPPEELYDLERDPHETENLIDNPEVQQRVEQLRGALDEWLEKYAEFGLLPESELIEQWRPDGVPQKTATPSVQSGNYLSAACATAGASIAWTMDPPRELQPLPIMARAIGLPIQDGRQWHLYTGPFEAPVGDIWVRAWRLGYEPSEEVQVRVN